jgi:hypothetical protein
MSDPDPAGSPLAQEAAARRVAQANRAERARLRRVDREIAAACPECGPAGAGGGDAGMHPGYVPVSRETVDTKTGEVKIDPRTGHPELVVEWRPCFTCNPDRWRAWQEGNLRSSNG